MSDDPERINLIDALGPIMDEHVEWFAQLVRSAFYPDAPKSKKDIDMPENFRSWLEETMDEGLVDSEEFSKLCQIYQDLEGAAEAFLEAALAKNKMPSVELYDTFVSLYDYFVIKIRRVERESLLEEGGIDHETGLRSKSGLHKELERELERRTRKGEPFAVVVVHFDFLDQVIAKGPEELRRITIGAAEVLVACIRPFDDAYHVGDGEFTLCLKNTDEMGAGAVVRRIRDYLVQHPVSSYDEQGNVASLSLSYCLSELSPGDSIQEVLAGMKQNLKEHEDKANSFMQFKEMSPLQRYLSEVEEVEKLT